MKLTERQRRFSDEYIKTGNAYRSCINAGYSEKYALTNSHKLLENTRIKSYIDERLDSIKSYEIAEQKEILAYLTRVMRGQETDTEVIPISVGNGKQELKEIDKKVDSNIRVKSAELLGKSRGSWKGNQDYGNKVIMINVGEYNDDYKTHVSDISEKYPDSTILINDVPLED